MISTQLPSVRTLALTLSGGSLKIPCRPWSRWPVGPAFRLRVLRVDVRGVGLDLSTLASFVDGAMTRLSRLETFHCDARDNSLRGEWPADTGATTAEHANVLRDLLLRATADPPALRLDSLTAWATRLTAEREGIYRVSVDDREPSVKRRRLLGASRSDSVDFWGDGRSRVSMYRRE